MWRFRRGFADLGRAVLKVGNDSALKNCRKNRLGMRPPLYSFAAPLDYRDFILY
jgi:hypothetical protein